MTFSYRAAGGSSGADSGYGGQVGRMSPQNFLPPSSTEFNNSVSGDRFQLHVHYCLHWETGTHCIISDGLIAKHRNCKILYKRGVVDSELSDVIIIIIVKTICNAHKVNGCIMIISSYQLLNLLLILPNMSVRAYMSGVVLLRPILS